MENQNQENGSGQQTINIHVPSVDNIASRRSLIPVLFAITIVFFFFNFFTISCGGEKVGSVTGINLVTGTELKGSDMFSGEETEGEKIPSNVWAIIALGSAVIGLGAFLIKERREAVIGTGAGIIGFCSLIILQFVVKNAIDKEAEGAPIETDFHFAFWGALIAIGIAGFLCYWRMQKTIKIAFNTKPPSSTLTSNLEDGSQVQKAVSSNSQESSIDISKWIRKNIRLITGIIVVGALLICAYYFFIKPNPVKEAKNVAVAFCDCSKMHYDNLININEEFIKSFDSFGFKKRLDARNKLNDIQESANTENSKCLSNAQQEYDKLRNRYIAEKELLEKFDFAYEAQKEICGIESEGQFVSLLEEVESKISTIVDPEPDLEKIKTDLIGQQIPGWRFSYLNEFKSAEIVNKTKGNDRLEFQIKLLLQDNTTNSEHDCEIMTVYLQDDDGWYFDEVNLFSITFINTIYPDKWTEIVPLQNCRWNCEDNYKIVWKTSSYGSEILSGPDAIKVVIPNSSKYYVRSREDKPVNVKFTYIPI